MRSDLSLRRVKLRATAHSLGVRLEIHQTHWDQRDMQRALDLISAERERIREQLGFELWGIRRPTPAFIGLTLRGIALGDAQSGQLPPELLDAVREEIVGLLRETPIGRDEVRIEYGERSVPLSVAEAQPSHLAACACITEVVVSSGSRSRRGR